jgi:hypothetical protein
MSYTRQSDLTPAFHEIELPPGAPGPFLFAPAPLCERENTVLRRERLAALARPPICDSDSFHATLPFMLMDSRTSFAHC